MNDKGFFIDGSCSEEFFDYGDYYATKKQTIKVEIGGAASMGSIYIDGKQEFIADTDCFKALRECLNRLWEASE